ncbi:RidA family protein [Lacihabitans sp. CCS-44]|uniref:RidA family protein n=1 Tax=Lacihabitans sp. CCS-44 TaxID=2487331 RepID=UPI0020CE5813|nr:RidA family protein [Lacihabitans sp. CCS-44]MCP9756490.1 RidA family protein [Lacihabitans sp. CCS-44]
MEKHFINPPELPNWKNAFSQVVVVKSDSIQTIYLSGQVSANQNNELIGENDLQTQATQAFLNLQAALGSAGATTSDVVKINIFVKDYNPSKATIVGDAFRKAFPHEKLPASTWLGVQALALEGLLIEIDAIAVIAA